MASVYAEDELAAAQLAGSIGDGPTEQEAGTATKVASATTLVITHSFTAAPDFVMITPLLKASVVPAAIVVTTTHVAMTRTTATSSWSVSYIIGYTA